MPFFTLGLTKIPLNRIVELPKVNLLFFSEAGGPERLPLGREGPPTSQEGQDAGCYAHRSHQRNGSLTLYCLR